MTRDLCVAFTAALLLCPHAAAGTDSATRTVRSFNFRSLRLAVQDLSATYGTRYSKGPAFLLRLDDLEKRRAAVLASGSEVGLTALGAELERLRYDALLAPAGGSPDPVGTPQALIRPGRRPGSACQYSSICQN